MKAGIVKTLALQKERATEDERHTPKLDIHVCQTNREAGSADLRLTGRQSD